MFNEVNGASGITLARVSRFIVIPRVRSCHRRYQLAVFFSHHRWNQSLRRLEYVWLYQTLRGTWLLLLRMQSWEIYWNILTSLLLKHLIDKGLVDYVRWEKLLSRAEVNTLLMLNLGLWLLDLSECRLGLGLHIDHLNFLDWRLLKQEGILWESALELVSWSFTHLVWFLRGRHHREVLSLRCRQVNTALCMASSGLGCEGMNLYT